MILPVHCRASETDKDKKQIQSVKQDHSTQQETKKSDTQIKEKKIIRVGSFEDTFDYVDANGTVIKTETLHKDTYQSRNTTYKCTPYVEPEVPEEPDPIDPDYPDNPDDPTEPDDPINPWD